MESEISVTEISSGLKSVRATDRKKSAETLKDLLTRSTTLPSLLTKNTLLKKGYTWNTLFDDINEYILKETEKFENSKTYAGTIRPLCSTLLHSCVAGANRGKTYITCSKITKTCLYILKDNRLLKAIGDEYLSLLYKDILSHEHYLSHITPNSWKELLEVCIAACFSDNFNLDIYTKVKLLHVVMKSGRDNCQFIKPLANSLPVLEKYFSKVTYDKKAQDVVLEIIILLLETLSTEYRLTMCRFTEDIFPLLVKFYDQNKEQKKKSSLFKLLNLTVILHHPHGKLCKEEGSLANDWDLWNKRLNSITEIICIEVIHLQKNRKQTERALNHCSHFYNLAAFTHYQLFNTCGRDETDTETVLLKRQKFSFNKNKTFSDILNEMHQNHLPWLGIIHAYVKKYGASVSTRDYLTLLNYIQILLTNDNILQWTAFEELTCAVLKNLSSYINKDEYDNTYISLWNACVRDCTSMKASHKCVHTIMCLLLNFNFLKYEHAQHLIKLYFEKGMPVTDYSIKTISNLFHKFYSKCGLLEFRVDCFNWLFRGDLKCLQIGSINELVLRIISSENINSLPICTTELKNNNLREILFYSIEKCILFSEFEETVVISPESEQVYERIEIINDVASHVEQHLKIKLSESISKLQRNHSELQECIRLIEIVLSYLDTIIKHKFKKLEEVKRMAIFVLMKESLKVMFSSLVQMLQSNALISTKDAVVNLVLRLLLTEFEPLLNDTLRVSINGDFFHCINKLLHNESEANKIIDDDDSEVNMIKLKHSCVYVLAAYCRKDADYRDELLKLILHIDLYNFPSDILCVFKCIDILKDRKVGNPPLDLIFIMMQNICKDWYRDAKISLGFLRILVDLIDPIFSNHGPKKENCIIMVKGYVQLCEDMHYSPQVASLIYECAAKIAVLNRQQNNYVETFERALINKLKGDVHSIRLYCCYLLKMVVSNFSDDDIEKFLNDLLEIFIIDVVEGQEFVLKDESANRTLTVLHTFFALVQGKKSSFHNIILQIINVQKNKSLDKLAVQKVLNKILNVCCKINLQTYMNDNIVPVIHFWFSRSYSLEELPLYLFGYDDFDMFLKMHMKWLVAADILWNKNGNITDSDVLNRVKNTQGVSAEDVLETCFSHIIVLCLPYVVCEKYNIECYGFHKPEFFMKLKKYAIKAFELMCKMLEGKKFNSLFSENLGELLLLAATHLSDQDDAARLFKVHLPLSIGSYCHTKQIFINILNYFQDLTDRNVIQYLCHKQPTSIYKILLELWKNVLNEHIIQYKVLALHAYVTFVQNVPLDCPTDAFVCNFVCKSFTYAIMDSVDKEELRVCIEGLKISLKYLLPKKFTLMRVSVLELLPILVIKGEEGFQQAFDSILEYLTGDLKDYLKASEDIIDFLNSMSQGEADICHCSSKTIFLEKLKAYKISLKCPSHETLLKLRQFLKVNNHFVHDLWNDMSTIRFSEDCKSSLIHQFVYSISCILKSSRDDKTIIEACNCLSEIGSYDLKTLVTLPDQLPQEVTNLDPKQYFAVTVVKSLLEVLFDSDIVIISKVIETLTSFLQCRQIDEVFGLDEIQVLILRPFLPKNSRCVDIKIDSIRFQECIIEFVDGIFLNALVMNGNNSEDWLKQVTYTLLRTIHSPNKDIDILREVCMVKTKVSREVLPPLVGVLLHCLREQQIKNISEQINKFFNYIWEQTFDMKVQDGAHISESPRSTSELNHDHKMIVQYMLDVIDFVRVQRTTRARIGLEMKQLNCLELEYDKIAWAAAVANQNWTAVYYAELCAVFRNNGTPPTSPEATRGLPGGDNLLRILRKCYASIGEIDAIEGCGTAHLTIENEKRRHLINSGQYSDALLLYDIALSCGSSVDQDLHLGVVRSLHKSGMHHLALQYIKSQPDNETLSDVKYECLSFLGDWSEFVDPRELEEKSKQTNCHRNSIIKAFQYSCLKNCLNVQNKIEHEKKVLLPVNMAKLAVSRLCRNLNLVHCQNIYKVLAKIHVLNDIEDYFLVRTNKSELSWLLKRWNIKNLPKFCDFSHLEALISQRVLILDHAAKFSDSLIHEISSLQIQYAKMAVSNHRVEMAQRLLMIAKKSEASKDIILVESEILWAKGHKDIALSLLRNSVVNQSLGEKLSTLSLRQFALWMTELRRENPRDIINKYLIKSLRELKTDDIETRLKVYQDIAKFADAEYKQMVAYLNSSVYESRVKCVENMEGTASSLYENKAKLTNEEKKALACNRQFKVLDEAEIQNIKIDKDNFLNLAMRYYLLSLKQYDANNLLVFRVISLWLENRMFNFTYNDGDVDSFEDLLHAIPSWKFISALPQLAPHITNEDNAFINNLMKIINRCAIDHPHHTLPILFSLKNSKKDSVILNASGSSVSATHARTQDARTLAADAVVQQLACQSDLLNLIINQTDQLCDAIISFANFQVSTQPKKQKIPVAERIHKLKNLNVIPVPTVTIPIRVDCNYSYIHTLVSFEPYFELVGGVNAPKKVKCTDSSGKNHVMLIKGRDDLRQDAVMQQVFNIVNALLESDSVTNRSKLLIRTYKVVPMSRQSGVLEWCEGTIPLGAYLTGDKNNGVIGAHSRYHPQDISCEAARKKMIDCHNKSNEVKLRTFIGILKMFNPVFHYFFTEHYLDPVTWYERRLAYTKSVATTSMLGYILGLGDRHVFNILIDQRTAEVIHIDLGISFEQGKTLPTPETVPFRLTQDIVSGFGSCGVEGIFRRCCEKTMQLLRDNQEILLTILEVLLCDPLYSWSVKTAQQNGPSTGDVAKEIPGRESHSGLAARALLVVASKLSGTEEGAAGGVAVAGQVARLLHGAADPANLSRVYHGWQPYL